MLLLCFFKNLDFLRLCTKNLNFWLFFQKLIFLRSYIKILMSVIWEPLFYLCIAPDSCFPLLRLFFIKVSVWIEIIHYYWNLKFSRLCSNNMSFLLFHTQPFWEQLVYLCNLSVCFFTLQQLFIKVSVFIEFI